MNPRIISGSAKNTKLEVPRRGTRPMTDRTKSALFSIIQNIIPNANVLDLYAGTGALGIEMLSRGAQKAVFVDRSKHAIRAIKSNLENTNLNEQAIVIKCSTSRFLDEYSTYDLKIPKFDIIFFTPPHDNFKERVLVKTAPLIAPKRLLIAEHSSQRRINEDKIEGLKKIETREYGGTHLTFFTI